MNQPTTDSDDLSVYIGALIPLRLYHLLLKEAKNAGVSRSEILRRALADRYKQRGAKAR